MAGIARRPLVAGNWKMHGTRASAAELGKIVQGHGDLWRNVDVLVCPPATLLFTFAVVAVGSKVGIGAQDCHVEPAGAFTGDISAEMLTDAGATSVIVGHSERRTHHSETDEHVRVKALAVWRAGLTAIVCIGETKAQREARETLAVVRRQLDASLPDDATASRLVVAYEPVWAIGSGQTPSPADIAEVHNFVRERLVGRYGAAEGEGIRVLYGGSVKPDNAKDLLRVDNVDGALVGGASLKAEEFLGIAAAYR
jgi:triosephosphate isomerase